MKDALRSKLDVILVASVAFATGLVAAAGLDVTPPSLAAGFQSPELQTGASPEQARRLEGVDFRRGFAPIVDEISGSVVTIRVEKQVEQSDVPRFRIPSPFDDFFDDPRQQRPEPPLRQGSGSGFIISPQGYIVTNNHVVDGAESITVQLADRREFSDVTVVGRDPQTDVALLKIDAEDLQAAPLGDSQQLQVGEWVLAIGSPGFESPGGSTILESTITAGIVSAKGRSINILTQQSRLAIEDFIQTDAVINRGNSGGPLVNMQGEVVGMSTAIMSETGTYQGYGFAVPTALIRQVVDDLMQYGEVRRAVLGITIQAVTPEDARYLGLEEVRGVEVNDFSPLAAGESPARQAGMQRGDVILSVDGSPVYSVSDLQTRIRSYEPGETVTLGVARRVEGETRRLEIEVELGAVESGAQQEQPMAAAELENPLGVRVEPLDQEARRELNLPGDVTGVLVTGLSRRSPLVRAAPGWAEFTLVTEIDGRRIEGMDDYREAVAGLEPGTLTRVQLYFADPQGGQGQFTYVTVEIPRNGG